MGINEDFVKQKGFDLTKFCDAIKKSICDKSKSEFCSYYRISHENKSSEYALYFCSKNPKGLEQFIASLKKVDILHPKAYQLSFFDEDPEQYIINHIKTAGKASNVGMYKLGILNGYYSKEINEQLKKLEYNNKVVVSPMQGKERKPNKYYVGYDYYKNKNTMICITLK